MDNLFEIALYWLQETDQKRLQHVLGLGIYEGVEAFLDDTIRDRSFEPSPREALRALTAALEAHQEMER